MTENIHLIEVRDFAGYQERISGRDMDQSIIEYFDAVQLRKGRFQLNDPYRTVVTFNPKLQGALFSIERENDPDESLTCVACFVSQATFDMFDHVMSWRSAQGLMSPAEVPFGCPWIYRVAETGNFYSDGAYDVALCWSLLSRVTGERIV